jgi:hypothetical protein
MNKNVTKRQITHKRERWMIFIAIFAVVWFKNQPNSNLQPTQYALQAVSVLIGSGLMYALFGRIVLWVWLGLYGFVAALAEPFAEAARNRAEMKDLTVKLMRYRPDSLERRLPTPMVIPSEPAAPAPTKTKPERRILN